MRSVGPFGGFDSAALRAVLDGLSPPSRSSERPPDPMVLALVTDPFTSVADARSRLATLERTFRETDDRRAVFLTLYARVTKAVEVAIDADTFCDADWVARYLVTFADYYRRSLLAFERGTSLPAAWRLAFETAVSGEALVVQDVFLGVNAHVNYDLAFALRDAGVDPRPDRYADHVAVNEVLARLVDETQTALATVYAPGIEDLDATLGGLDELLALGSLRSGRERAWRQALALVDARWEWVDRTVRWFVAASALGFARGILSPSFDPRVEKRLKRLESDRPLAAFLDGSR